MTQHFHIVTYVREIKTEEHIQIFIAILFLITKKLEKSPNVCQLVSR